VPAACLEAGGNDPGCCAAYTAAGCAAGHRRHFLNMSAGTSGFVPGCANPLGHTCCVKIAPPTPIRAEYVELSGPTTASGFGPLCSDAGAGYRYVWNSRLCGIDISRQA